MDFDVNDDGWVAATSTAGGAQAAERFQLVGNGTAFTLVGGGRILDSAESNTLAINQARNAAGERFDLDGTSTVFAYSLGGTPLSLPTSIHRSDFIGVYGVTAVNDATSAHRVQVLAEITTVDRSGYINRPRWSILEDRGTITLVDDAVAYPANWPYDATWSLRLRMPLRQTTPMPISPTEEGSGTATEKVPLL
ncbi:MAG: hypothetical protein KDB03_27825 [Planctomycetales bacterium]|nr:hypothetical protein [Planctomycetales bacterium]